MACKDKKIIIVSGIPGSGKTTLAKTLSRYPEYSPALVISSDDIRFELTGSYNNFTKENEKAVWATLVQRAIDAVNTYNTVIIDSTALTNKKRMYYWHQLHKYFCHFDLIILKYPASLCVERDRQRDRHVPEEEIIKMASYLQEPNFEVRSRYEHIIVQEVDRTTIIK